ELAFAYRVRAEAESQLGQAEAARQDHERAKSLGYKPGPMASVSSHSLRALHERSFKAYQLARQAEGLIGLGKVGEARLVLEKATGLDCNTFTDIGHARLGHVSAQMAQYERAIAEYEKALNFSTRPEILYADMAAARLRQANIPEALKLYEKSLSIQLSEPIEKLKARLGVMVSGNPASPDYFSQVTGRGIARWPQSRLPLKVFMSAPAGIPGAKGSYKIAFVDALNMWTRVSGHRLRWIEVKSAAKADVVLRWTNRRADVVTDGGD